VGMALVFVPLQNLALSGVAAHDAGAASATANSAMQIGGSIGLSVFTAVYAVALEGSVGHQTVITASQLTPAFGATFVAAAVGMVVASILAITLVRGTKARLLPQGTTAAVAVH
jgi:hypothetical protein